MGGKGGAIEPMGLIGAICAAIVFFFLIGYLAGPCYQTKRIPQVGGETKTKFYWGEYVAKNSAGETTTKYDAPNAKLEKIKQILDAVLCCVCVYPLCGRPRGYHSVRYRARAE